MTQVPTQPGQVPVHKDRMWQGGKERATHLNAPQWGLQHPRHTGFLGMNTYTTTPNSTEVLGQLCGHGALFSYRTGQGRSRGDCGLI